IVLLMLGWKYTPTGGGGGADGSKSTTECGAGNSRLFWMKQAGNGQVAPAAPTLGVWGKAMNAKMSMRMTAAIKPIQRCEIPRRDFGSGAGASPAVSATTS